MIIPIAITTGLVCTLILALAAIGVAPLNNWLDAQLLEARAGADTAAAQLAEAQAERIHASGEYEIFAAAAQSVRKDSNLVAWYAVRRDILTTMITCSLVPFWASAGAVLAVLAYNKGGAVKL